MDHIPCRERTFPFTINIVTFYAPYLSWLIHLSERLGLQNTLSVWENTFAEYDDTLLMNILSSDWHKVVSDGANHVEENINKLVLEFFPSHHLELSTTEVRNIIEDTPPISKIKQLFFNNTMEAEITAYEALHLRFDGLACLAEKLIKKFGKQGELIVYDLMVKERLAAGKGESGSVEEFIENFSAESKNPNLFTAGLETELMSKTETEAVLYVRECEWARYFQEFHPQVGYLLACSTDEVAYKAFNKNLGLQRTLTIMEGGEMCDFRVFAIDKS